MQLSDMWASDTLHAAQIHQHPLTGSRRIENPGQLMKYNYIIIR